MSLAVLAYQLRSLPDAAPDLPGKTGLFHPLFPDQKKALRTDVAGPVLFYRERAIALKGFSAVCPMGLFAFPVGGIKNASCRVFRQLIEIFHARNAFPGKGIGRGLTILQRQFAGFSRRHIRKNAFGFFARGAFLCSDQRKRRSTVLLRHGDGGCGTGNKNKTGDGKRDFATLGAAHGFVSLGVIIEVMLMLERVVFRVLLMGILPDDCAGKRDQLCVFQGSRTQKGRNPHLSVRLPDNVFSNALSGGRPRRVAHGDGLAYVRRTPIFDGDTAR